MLRRRARLRCCCSVRAARGADLGRGLLSTRPGRLRHDSRRHLSPLALRWWTLLFGAARCWSGPARLAAAAAGSCTWRPGPSDTGGLHPRTGAGSGRYRGDLFLWWRSPSSGPSVQPAPLGLIWWGWPLQAASSTARRPRLYAVRPRRPRSPWRSCGVRACASSWASHCRSVRAVTVGYFLLRPGVTLGTGGGAVGAARPCFDRASCWPRSGSWPHHYLAHSMIMTTLFYAGAARPLYGRLDWPSGRYRGGGVGAARRVAAMAVHFRWPLECVWRRLSHARPVRDAAALSSAARSHPPRSCGEASRSTAGSRRGVGQGARRTAAYGSTHSPSCGRPRAGGRTRASNRTAPDIVGVEEGLQSFAAGPEAALAASFE